MTCCNKHDHCLMNKFMSDPWQET